MMSEIELFISYAHEDEALKNELFNHLKNLMRQNVLRAWHDRKIGAGQEWAGQIDKHLNSAQLILLLISSDFMASDYCNDIELKRAMERHEAGEARVVPIILRPVDWTGAVFGKLNALPKDGLPVTKWADRDEAFLSIVGGIKSEITRLKIQPLLSKFVKSNDENEKIELGERILSIEPDFQFAADFSMRSMVTSLYVCRALSRKERLGPRELFSPVEDIDREKEYKLALTDFDRALELCPNDAEILCCRGDLRATRASSYAEPFDYYGALADYNRAIELAPDIGGYYYARAQLNDPTIGMLDIFKRGISISEQRKKDAQRDYQRAIQLGAVDPKTGLPKINFDKK